MHPALSVIVFTMSSGVGYGLLLWLGLLAPNGLVPPDRWFGLAGMFLALVLIAAGLVSSTFHLGHPERAWRAITQWRSSWLSREGLSALLTFAPAGLFAIGWVFVDTVGGVWAVFGLLASAGAIVTVYCTAMIYRSLKPIRQWDNDWVGPIYLAMAGMSGAVWLDVLIRCFGFADTSLDAMVILWLVVTWGMKFLYWRDIDGTESVSTPESATGLGTFGEVRLLDPPHTQENYLMREMGFQIARKHSTKLRQLALLLGFAAPAVLMVVLLLLPAGWLGALVAILAALSVTTGIAIERWLFFAEARHTVTLYYGRRAA